MKKLSWIFIIVGSALLMLIGLWILPTNLKHETLVNTLKKDFKLNFDLYYADINMLDIDVYNFNGKKLKKSFDSYASYTEGFIPRSKSTTYLELINNFRKAQNLPPKNYFHDFYEDETRVIISFTGSLADIYIIDKATNTVSPLNYSTKDNLGEMYVSHIKPYGNKLIILAGKANAYASFIYEVSLDSYTILDSINLPTSPDATQDVHYGITSNGQCIFINGSKLKIYDIDTHAYHFVDLPFHANVIKVIDNQILVLSVEDDKLLYSILNENLEPLYTNTLTSPIPSFKLVDFGLVNNYLYLASYDPNNAVYPNYITLYTDQGEMAYCERFTMNKDKALLEVNAH